MTILGRTQFLALVGCVAAVAIAASALATSSPAPTNWSVKFTPLAQRILVGADADAVVLPDGQIRLYWATGEGSGSAVSKDGVHFSKEPGIRLDPSIGGPHTRIVALPDGRWRLFFIDGNRHGIGSAVSDDGLAFTVEPGLRVSAAAAGLAPKDLSPGDILRLPDGRWRMYFSSFSFAHRDPRTVHEVVKSAVSSDLLHWTVEPGVRVGGGSGITGSAEHPAAIRLADGSVALFYGRPLPFHAYVARSRNGVTFAAELPFVDSSLDTAVVARRDGSLLVYYGTYVPKTNTSYLNVGKLVFHATPPVPTCTVPDVRGTKLPVAKRRIVAAHCSVGAIRYVYSTRNAAGWVLSQRPAGLVAAPTYAKGTHVALVVSRGPHPK